MWLGLLGRSYATRSALWEISMVTLESSRERESRAYDFYVRGSFATSEGKSEKALSSLANIDRTSHVFVY